MGAAGALGRRVQDSRVSAGEQTPAEKYVPVQAYCDLHSDLLHWIALPIRKELPALVVEASDGFNQ